MKVNNAPMTWPASDNMGGFKDHVVFIPASSVSAAPVLPAITDISDDADFVTAVGAFVFKTVGDKPKYIQCTGSTVKFGAANQGEIEGQSFAQSGEFFRAGNKEEFAAFARQVNNVPGYLVLEDMNGNQVLVGQPGLPAYLKPDYEGGQKRADRRGLKVTFTSDALTPFIYLATPIDVDALLV